MEGVSRCKQIFAIIFLGKRLLLSEKPRLICPRCKSKMKKVEKKKIVIDVCQFCGGIFLDDGEIEKLSKLQEQSKLIPKKKAVKKKVAKKIIPKMARAPKKVK